MKKIGQSPSNNQLSNTQRLSQVREQIQKEYNQDNGPMQRIIEPPLNIQQSRSQRVSQEQIFTEYNQENSPPSSPNQDENNAAQTYIMTPQQTNLSHKAIFYNDDSLKDYLKKYKNICEKCRDAYDIHAVHLKIKHDLVTVPLLIITSATGVIAGLNISSTVGIIVGAASAVITAIQRYCGYAERSENARMTAKNHSRIIRKIDNMFLVMDSNIVNISKEMFSKFLRDIQSEIDSTNENAKDIPWELLKYINTIDASICCIPIAGATQNISLVDKNDEEAAV